MRDQGPHRRVPAAGRRYVLTLAIVGALPLAPEMWLLLHGMEDLKGFLPIAYYEAIVSFILLAPALVVPAAVARLWVIVVGGLMGAATAITGFYAACYGARWNLTAHAALFQTNGPEAASFLKTFGSWTAWLWTLSIVIGFFAAIRTNVASTRPRTGHAWAMVAIALGISFYGIRNAVVYGGAVTRRVALVDGPPVDIVEAGINKFHPLVLLAVTEHNYRATHRYYLQKFHDAALYRERMKGATPLPGSHPPRLVVVVIGESANRLHWSLYGYGRPTTPNLDRLRGELTVFTDVISSCAATLCSIRGMLTTPREAAPTFPLFEQAGFATHWLSAQYNQGTNDVEMGALVALCDDRRFLGGGYDENLVPLLAAAESAPGPQIIFLNLFGSHVRYQDRYPSAYSKFGGSTEKERLRSGYDNSILYTDHVLAEFIRTLRDRHESSCLLYVSDHGEDVYDSRPDRYLFRDETIATDPMYEVPFFVWLSPEYRSGNPGTAAAVAAARARPFQNRALYQSLLDLARLTHPLYDARDDLFSAGFVERERRVGVRGRLYRKSQDRPPAGTSQRISAKSP